MSSRTNLLLVVALSILVGALVFLDARRGRSPAPIGGDDARATPTKPGLAHVQYFDGGYAVGPAREIAKVIQAEVRGKWSACQQPEPTAEERAKWGYKERGVPFAQLLRTDDPTLAVEVTSRLLDKAYGPGFAKMTREEQNVFLVSEIDGWIENGGLYQYFVNAEGNCALRAVTALDEIGLTENSRLLRRASALFPDASPSENQSTRLDQLDALGARIDRLGGFGAHWEDSTSQIAAYVRAHAGAFSLPP
jgi:hypothetical protein